VIVFVAVLVIAIAMVVVRARRGDGLAGGLLETIGRMSTGLERDWIDAMLAEAESISDPGVRRRFLGGCVWAALRRPRRTRGASAVGGAIIVPVAVAAALAVIGLVHYPWIRAGQWWPVYPAVVAGVLALATAAWWYAARLASGTALRVGLSLALPVLLCSWLAMRSASSLSVAFALVPGVLPALAVLWIVYRDGDRDRASVAAVCGAVVVGVMFFVGSAATTLIAPSPRNPVLLAEFAKTSAPDYRTWAVADNLSGAAFMLVLLLVVGLASGAVATLAASRRH
jgi:hypothetical protein